jgi:CheY-like chemotaxis protein
VSERFQRVSGTRIASVRWTVGLAGIAECSRMLENGLRSTQVGDNVTTLWGKRVLVVEDDPIVAINYRFQLEDAGALQAFAPSNHRALAYLETHEIDAAIIDYHLTDGTCVPVLDLLITRHIPFVIVSGDTFGATDIPPGAPLLSKLSSPADVCEALSRALH